MARDYVAVPILAVAVAVLCVASPAAGGEEAEERHKDAYVEAGMIPCWLHADCRNGVEFRGDGLAFGLYLQAGRFGEGLSGEIRLSTMGSVSGLEVEGVESEAEYERQDTGGWGLAALVGWGFRLGEDWTVTPLAGMSYRDWSTRIEWDDSQVNTDTSLVTLDLGARIAGRLPDVSERTELVAHLLISQILAGDGDYEYTVPPLAARGTADVENGFAWEISVGWAYQLEDHSTVHVRFVYDHLSWELEGTGAPKQDVGMFSIQVGARFTF